MEELICKNCGGTLEFKEGDKVAVCDSCGKKITLPRFQSDVKKNLFKRASRLLQEKQFDKSMEFYEDALKEDAEDPEVYWSLVLCRYGVEYVEEASGKRVPTIHRIQETPVLVDESYKSALEYADEEQKEIYEAEAEEIERIQSAYLKIVRSEKPFDVFICYKETDENNKRTQDSVLAREIYDRLSNQGIKVFYAPVTLEDKLGEDYEPYIFAALQSSKVLIALGTKKDYFEAVWVRNEWSRFLSIMNREKKEKGSTNRTLIPAYKDMDAYDLPTEFARLQAMDMGKLGFIQDLSDGINKILRAGNKETKAQASTAAPAASNEILNLEKRMFNFLQDGDRKKAEEYAERILDKDPDNGKAYLGHLLVEAGCRNVNDLKMSPKLLPEYRYFTNAMEKGDAQQKEMLMAMTQAVTQRIDQERQDAKYVEGMRNLQKAIHTKDEQAAVNAMHAFKQIQDWRDAKAKAKESEELANEIRAEKKKAADEQAEKERKRRRRKLITKLVIAAVIILFIWYNVVGKKDMAYRKAVKMIKAEQYDEAYVILSGLKNYKGADFVITGSICDRANALVDEGNLSAAKDLLLPHMESGDVQNVMNRVNYEYGKDALARNDYDTAYSYLVASNSYADADDLMKESKYTRAEGALASEEYETVVDLLEEVGDYKEAEGMRQKSHYALAVAALAEENYGSALTHFYKAGDYENSEEQLAELLDGTLALGIYLPAYRVLLETDPQRAEELLSEQPWLGIVHAGIGSTIEIGEYEQDNDPDNGAEPVEWMVMDYRDGKYLLVSRCNLDSRAFDEEKEAEGLTWENSDIREWLNGEFLNTVFNDGIRRQVSETVNTNPDMSIEAMVEEFSVPGGLEYIEDYQGYENGEDTTDRVFLLSYPEYVRYGLVDSQPEDTSYARDRVNKAGGDGACVWTRTIANQDSPIFQIGDGRIYWGYGMGLTSAWHSYNAKGIRPALWFSVED